MKVEGVCELNEIQLSFSPPPKIEIEIIPKAKSYSPIAPPTGVEFLAMAPRLSNVG